MPLKFKQPAPSFFDQLSSLAPTGVRLAGGTLGSILSTEPGLGTAVGAGLGGGAEALAEHMEGSPFSAGRIATEAGLAAVPMGKIIKGGKALASAAGSGIYGASGEALREHAAGQDLDPTRIATTSGIGALLGFLGGKFSSPRVTEPAPQVEFDPNKPAANLVDSSGNIVSRKNVNASPQPPKVKTQRSPADIAQSSITQSLGKVLKTGPRAATKAGVADVDKGIEQAGQAGMKLRQDVIDEVPDVEKSHQQALDLLDKEWTDAHREDTRFNVKRDVQAAIQNGAEPTDPSIRTSGSFEGPEGRTTVSRRIEFPDAEADGNSEDDLFSSMEPGNNPPKPGGKGGGGRRPDMRKDVNSYQQTLYKGWLDRGRNPVEAAKLARKGVSWSDISPIDEPGTRTVPTTEPAAHLPEPEPEAPVSPLAKAIGVKPARAPKLKPEQVAGMEAVASRMRAEGVPEEAIQQALERAGVPYTAPPPPAAESLPSEAPSAPQTVSPAQPAAQELPEAFKPFAEPPQAPPAAATAENPLMQLFKSRVDAAGQHYRELKALVKGGDIPAGQADALKEGRGVAGRALQREGKEAGLEPTPRGKAVTPPVPQQPSAQTPQASAEYAGWQPDEPGGFPLFNVKGGPRNESTVGARTLQQEGIPLPEPTTEQATGLLQEQLAEVEKLKAAGMSLPDILTRLKSESGGVDPSMLLHGITTVAGGALGAAEGHKHNHTLAGMLLGAGAGAAAPLALQHLTGQYARGTEKVTEAVPYVRKGLDIANSARNTALLSPLSTAKKALGDVGGLTSALLENPIEGPQLLKTLLTPSAWGEAKDAFKGAFNQPLPEEASGIEKTLGGKALSFFPRVMGGLTAGTKNLLEQGGLGHMADYYTMTSEPETDVAAGLLRAQRGSLLGQHIAPFARMGLNRLERGMERSPLGLLRGRMWDPETQQLAIRQAALGSAAIGGALEATPDDFLKKHPVEASLISAAAGPYGVPLAAAMAYKSRSKTPGTQAAQEVSKDIPGLRFIEEFGSPSRFFPNYLAGYTNVLSPLARLMSPQDVETSKHFWQPLESNIPGLRGKMAKKLPPLKFR